MQSVRHLMFYSGTFQAEREYRNFFCAGSLRYDDIYKNINQVGRVMGDADEISFVSISAGLFKLRFSSLFTYDTAK